MPTPERSPAWRHPAWRGAAARGALAWALGWAVASALDGVADLGGQALPLVLCAAVAALWWPLRASVAMATVVTLAFNWRFVEPRGSLHISLGRDVLLLLSLLAAAVGVSLLVARLRRLAAVADEQARRMGQLYDLSEAMRRADGPAAIGQALRDALVAPEGGAVRVVCWPSADEPVGGLSADELDGLRLCAREGQALGPGTGRFEAQPACYLPMRGRGQVPGAVLLEGPRGWLTGSGRLGHLQALCDLAGQTLARLQADEQARRAAEAAEVSAVRSTLLASISHDYRTPLACIVGAASAIAEQGERLAPGQRQRLAETIVDEARQLVRLTDNALQLARLSHAPVSIRRDWESVEELVGPVLRRARARDGGWRVRARLSPGLPLLRCDAVLLVQCLENLLDNALSHGGPTEPVQLLCRRVGPRLLLAVSDRGPGLPPGEVDRLLQPFERGPQAQAQAPRGTGVGLALCQAVARAHGSALCLHPRRGGGLLAGLWLALEPQPAGEAPWP